MIRDDAYLLQELRQAVRAHGCDLPDGQEPPLPAPLDAANLRDEFDRRPTSAVLQSEIEEAERLGERVLFVQLIDLPDNQCWMMANPLIGDRLWYRMRELSDGAVAEAFTVLVRQSGRPIRLFPHGALTARCRMKRHSDGVTLGMLAYPPILEFTAQEALSVRPGRATGAGMSHLDRLESEAIFIMREAVAEGERPVMMYSAGKDSSVMMHLARKAFHPAPPPFPLLHIDTRWEFREVYLFRDDMIRRWKVELIVYTNPEAIERNINPIDHGSAVHTNFSKTEALKQALDKYQFDTVFGGARRDQERSRAKERVFSFRTAAHRWDPKNQRPELWNAFNARKRSGESMRVFPLSNWTELDVWQYIYRERIPVVPLYFAKERPVINRNGLEILVDDDRLKLLPGEVIERRSVRFRTLGCYPLTGAIASEARTIGDIIVETIKARTSERNGRAIDSDSAGSMERKKQEGYF